MKKSTIWIIAIVMGASFLALLYLQTGYFEEAINMRKQQFDESVSRSLYQAARNVELNETQAALEKEVKKTLSDDKRRRLEADEELLNTALNGNGLHGAADSLSLAPATTPVRPSAIPKGLIIRNQDAIGTASETLREAVRERYIYQKALLDEVIYSLLSQSNDETLAERIDFAMLDRCLKTELRNNGVNIDYHFTVTTTDGRELYRCSDYTPEGEEMTYKQVIYPNNPPAQMAVINIHFPEMNKYLFASAKFMIPAIIFTLILLIIFIFTICLVFRQKRLTEIKNDFINNMTHEFKTPISTISLAAQMLNDPAVGKSDAMFKHISGIINDETKRLRFQVEKVLQMSMFDRQKAATFKLKEIRLNELISDVATTFRLKVESSGGTLETDLQAQEDTVFADEMHFTNVIFNLLDNAVKYKDPEKELRLKVSTWNEGQKVAIAIQDNGIVIKKEDLKKIFEKFYRVHTGNRHDVKGFGLGLAYVKNVITNHKGNIHAESDFGKGTKFIITLPYIKS